MKTPKIYASSSTAITLLLLAEIIFCSASLFGESCYPYILQVKKSSESNYKCGFTEYTNATPPIIKKYFVQTIHAVKTSLLIVDDPLTNSPCWNNFPGCCGYCRYPGDFKSFDSSSYDATVIETYPYIAFSCSNILTKTFSGQSLVTNYFKDTRPFDEVCCNGSSRTTNHFGWYYESGILDNGGWTYSTASENYKAYENCSFQSICPQPNGVGWVTNGQSVSISTNIPSVDGSAGEITSIAQTEMTLTETPPPVGGSGIVTMTLSDEFTDAKLREAVLGVMPEYPTNWGSGTAEAYSIIDSSHVAGSLGRASYRFCIPNSESNMVYIVKWSIVKTSPDGSSVLESSGVDEITGTGDPNEPAPGNEQGDLNTPPEFWSGVITSETGTAKVTKSLCNVTVTAMPIGNSLAGSGPGEGAGGCTSCGTPGGGAASATTLNFGGATASFHLGNAFLGASAGSLRLWLAKPSANSANPIHLKYTGNRPDVEIVKEYGAIRQAKAPQALADVIINNQFKYEIRFYSPADVGSTNGSGIYELVGNPLPFVTWTIENPDASAIVTNRLRLTETRASNTKIFDYVYYSPSNSWIITLPGAIRADEVSLTNNVANQTRTETLITRDVAGSVISKFLRRYQTFSWGEGIVEETASPDLNPQTTTYSYYDESEIHVNGYYTPLKMTIRSNGEWEYNEYLSDGSGRKSAVYSGFKDYIPELNSIPNSSQCRLIQYYYDPVDGSDNGTLKKNVPRAKIEYLEGQEISRSYTIIRAFEQRDYQCQSQYASWDAADNLVTITTNYTSGSHVNQPRSIEHHDGTMTFYLYDYNTTGDTLTNTVKSGQPNGSKNEIVDGIKTVTVIGATGQMVSKSVTDISSGILLSRETYSLYDTFSRPQRVTHLDGTYEETQYSCCTLESTTDRDGVTTTYGYDALMRQITRTRLGITWSNILDAAGQVIRAVRIGTDATQIVLGQNKYNIAGELIYQTNALNGVISLTENFDEAGHLVRTTTNPDNGTQIETYYKDGSALSVTGTGVYSVYYEYGIEWESSAGRSVSFTKEIKGSFAGGEWVKTYTDMLGRPYKIVYADNTPTDDTDNPFARTFYNDIGQRWKQVDPDGVVTLYLYNSKGEVEYNSVDINTNDTIDFSGVDRIARTISDVTIANGTNVRRIRKYVWGVDNQNTSKLVSTMESSTDGLRSWNTVWNNGQGLTSRSQIVFGGSGYRYQTNIAPDNSYSVSIACYGTNVSSARYDSLNAQLSSVSFAYDAHGRQNRITDARNGTTTNWFNNADQVSGIKTPSPSSGQSAQITTNYFDTSGRIWKTTLPDNTSVTNEFFLTGMLKKAYGSRTYPVEYTYDYAGRMKTMKTWQGFANNFGAATTTWNYNLYRGWLDNKRYDDNTGPNYTYTAAGRVASRTWARLVSGSPLVTTCSYNHAGDMSGVDYSDNTPDVTYSYDRSARQTSVAQSGGTTTSLKYDDLGNLLSESYSGGPLNGLIVSNRFDMLARRTNVALLNSPYTILASTAYGYDDASRLNTVADGNNTVAYSYLANSPLVGNVWFTNTTALRMTTTKNYDLLNRLTGITSAAGGSNVAVFNYANNSANQRTSITNADNSRWVYQYDSLGQVVSGKKYWADGTPVAGQQFDYGFDDIGNRKTTAAGGDAAGASLRYASYTNNSLNQITSRSVPGFVNVLGMAKTNATVTLWGDNGAFSATSRKGEYFRGELAATNTAAAFWLGITNLAVLNNGTNADIVTNTFGKMLVAKTSEAFTYDSDGNQTSDSVWTNVWNGENRRITIESIGSLPVGAKTKEVWTHLADGRWIERIVSTNNGTAYYPMLTNHYVWDGQILLAVLDHTNGLVVSFTRGLDLSGSLQGAGGVGGVMALKVGTSAQVGSMANTTHFTCYDGNGNVSALVNSADGGESARYDYGPFAEPVRMTGVMAKLNPIRFSTQYADDVCGYTKYLFRDYTAETGRWLSRDPLGESIFKLSLRQWNDTLLKEELGAYEFCHNAPHDYFDQFGMAIDEIRREGRNVTIILKITVYYENESEKKKFNLQEVANRIEESINYNWNTSGGHSFDCCKLSFKADVTADLNSTTIFGAQGVNEVEITSRDIGQSSVWGITDSIGLWAANPADDWVYAHEAGHLMGLGDDYSVVGASPRRTRPNPGHEGHMMAEGRGDVAQHEIDTIVKKHKIPCR